MRKLSGPEVTIQEAVATAVYMPNGVEGDGGWRKVETLRALCVYTTCSYSA